MRIILNGVSRYTVVNNQIVTNCLVLPILMPYIVLKYEFPLSLFFLSLFKLFILLFDSWGLSMGLWWRTISQGIVCNVRGGGVYYAIQIGLLFMAMCQLAFMSC